MWPRPVVAVGDGSFEGVVAVGGELCPEVLLAMYFNGSFPWPGTSEDKLLWWSPDPRLVLRPLQLHVSRSLRKSLREADWQYTLNARFPDVISACAGSGARQNDTWITPEVQDGFNRLHAMGFAHSVEVSHVDGSLLGGLYGLGIGRMFFGESMFSAASDASKAALCQLCKHLLHHGLSMIDCQVETGHLRGLGGELMSRDSFRVEAKRLCRQVAPKGLWLKQRLGYEVC